MHMYGWYDFAPYAGMQFQNTWYLDFFSLSTPSVFTQKIGIPTKFKPFDFAVVLKTFAKQVIES